MSRPAGTGVALEEHNKGEGRVLGLDLGRRRVGLAISDSERRVASPLSVLARGASHDDDHAHLARAVAETGANLVVVGLPLSLSGRVGPAAEEVQREVAELERALRVPVEVCDERFSTVVANRALMASGRKAPARREVVDQVAAADILQTWLDRHRNALRGPVAVAPSEERWRTDRAHSSSAAPQAGSAVP
jgi:putative holliday junction resolvase